MSGGMPISACLGRAEVMDSWPPSPGEALHTQTYLGHPPGCAAALAAIKTLEEEELIERAARIGPLALARLRERFEERAGITDVRGRGLLLAIEFDDPGRAEATCRGALERGVISLLAGDDGRVLSITPPLEIDRGLLDLAIDILADAAP